MGSETPTNCSCWRARAVEGTNCPRRMPVVMARMIQTTRKRSRKERPRREGVSVVRGRLSRNVRDGIWKELRWTGDIPGFIWFSMSKGVLWPELSVGVVA